MLDVWSGALADYRPDELDRASIACIRQCKFMPSLREFLDFADSEARERREAEAARCTYWAAMNVYNGVLSGRVNPGALETDRAWAQFEAAHGHTEYNPVYDAERDR
jgi:hypothetical protein